MNTGPPGALFAPDHLLVLAAVAALATMLVLQARRRSAAFTLFAARTLAVILVVDEAGWWVYLVLTHSPLTLGGSLPLQLCDAVIPIAAVALWSGVPSLVELTYFWGLAGSVQALLTPDLPEPFPSFPFFQYYVAHGGVVTAALLLVVGARHRPRPGAVRRVTAVTLAYVAAVGLVDVLTGGNYLYLRSKPASPSALDLLGPWPWYLAGAAIIGVVLLLLLDVPFRRGWWRR